MSTNRTPGPWGFTAGWDSNRRGAPISTDRGDPIRSFIFDFAQRKNKAAGIVGEDQATNTIVRFATDDFLPEHRFDQWREVRGKSLFGVTIELARDLRHSFRGSFQARAVAGAVVTDMRASSYRVNRTEADIARIAGDSL